MLSLTASMRYKYCECNVRQISSLCLKISKYGDFICGRRYREFKYKLLIINALSLKIICKKYVKSFYQLYVTAKKTNRSLAKIQVL